MPRKVKEMPAVVLPQLGEGLHFVGGVSGLALQVQPSGSRSWVLRYSIAGRRREMGLGGFPDVPLVDARRRAREEREKADKGLDPIAERAAAQSRVRADRAKAITFEKAARSFVEAQEAGWRNAKHAGQVRSTLASTYPTIGNVLVRDVELAHVLAVLEPIWREKTETASRLRGRIEAVLDWATARGYRDGPNPARWKGHLDHLLPAPAKIAKPVHHPAVPVGDVGEFIAALRQESGVAARALEFAVLTAARPGEVRGARWDEIDVDAAMWVVPAERMKAGKEHRVPLSAPALELVRTMPLFAEQELIFPAPRGGPLSDMALVSVMRRMGHSSVPHGFRSTFRDWAAENTNYPRDLAEMALAHTIGDKVEAAYRRGDMLAKRRRMMDDWAAFCAAPRPMGRVLPINSRASSNPAPQRS